MIFFIIIIFKMIKLMFLLNFVITHLLTESLKLVKEFVTF